MLLYKEWEHKPNIKNGSIESLRHKLLHIALCEEETKIKKRRLRKLIKKKLINRKRKEAFPRKGGKYNELFQDFGKESGTRDNPTKTG